MRIFLLTIVLAVGAAAQQAPTQSQSQGETPQLKSRTEIAQPETAEEHRASVLVVPAGTKIPIQLRQGISTKNAQPGDAIYGQTNFPIVIENQVVIPGGTYVQGVVDSVKRAGRIKGRAELAFHITNMVFSSGYTLSMAAAIDQVPGSESSRMKEPGTVQHDPEKGKDLERIGRNAAEGGAIGGIAGAAANPGWHGYGVGGLAGIGAGTLVGILARGSDVRFEPGTVVDVVLNHAIGIDPEKAFRLSGAPAYYPTGPQYIPRPHRRD
jgi:type IV secretion system protein VirB10